MIDEIVKRADGDKIFSRDEFRKFIKEDEKNSTNELYDSIAEFSDEHQSLIIQGLGTFTLYLSAEGSTYAEVYNAKGEYDVTQDLDIGELLEYITEADNELLRKESGIESTPLYEALEAYSNGETQELYDEIKNECLFENQVEDFIKKIQNMNFLDEDTVSAMDIDKEELKNIKYNAVVESIEDTVMNGGLKDAVDRVIDYGINLNDIDLEKYNENKSEPSVFDNKWLAEKVREKLEENAEKPTKTKSSTMKP